MKFIKQVYVDVFFLLQFTFVLILLCNVEGNVCVNECVSSVCVRVFMCAWH